MRHQIIVSVRTEEDEHEGGEDDAVAERGEEETEAAPPVDGGLVDPVEQHGAEDGSDRLDQAERRVDPR